MTGYRVADRVRVRVLPYSLGHQGETGRVVGSFGALVIVSFSRGAEGHYLAYELERV